MQALNMSETSFVYKRHSYCDACGESMAKANRIYKNMAYCHNCYVRCFEKRACSGCGEEARLLKTDPHAVCSKCERKKPCIRCGKVTKKTVRTTLGFACQPCYQRYFAEKKTCSECGKECHTVHNSSLTLHGKPVCLSCAQKRSHKSCPCCGKYRKMVFTDKGEMCQKCADQGQVPCPSCNQPMWAGKGSRCDTCYLQDRLSKEVDINKHLFRHTSIKQAYEGFVIWLAATRGEKKTVESHIKYLDFFERCDKLWGIIPDYEALVTEFKPGGLRTYLNALRWLIDTGQVAVDQALKDEMAEEQYIEKLLSRLGDNTPTVVQDYYDYLLVRKHERKTSLKSLRLALQPVVDIYHQFAIESENTPSQTHIDSYLTAKSGQKASLTGFMVFLRKTRGIELSCQVADLKAKKKDLQRIERKDAEKQLMALMKLQRPLTKTEQFEWIRLSLAFFHKKQLSLTAVKKLKPQGVEDGMMVVEVEGLDYPIPAANLDNTLSAV